jgi:hypothetical protein
MQTLPALLTEQGRYRSRRTFERRLAALPATLPAPIGCLGRRGPGHDRCGTPTGPWRSTGRLCSPVADNVQHAHDEDVDVHVERDAAEHRGDDGVVVGQDRHEHDDVRDDLDGDDAKHAHVEGDDGALPARATATLPGASVGSDSYAQADERYPLPAWAQHCVVRVDHSPARWKRPATPGITAAEALLLEGLCDSRVDWIGRQEAQDGSAGDVTREDGQEGPHTGDDPDDGWHSSRSAAPAWMDGHQGPGVAPTRLTGLGAAGASPCSRRRPAWQSRASEHSEEAMHHCTSMHHADTFSIHA